MDDKLFNIYFADLGGKVNLPQWEDFFLSKELYTNVENIEKELNNLSKSVTDLIRLRGRKESVYISITNDPTINGCCGLTTSNDYLVSLNIGVLIRLGLLSQVLWETNSGNKDLFSSKDRKWIYNIMGFDISEKPEFEINKITDPEESLEKLKEATEILRKRIGKCKTPPYVTTLAVYVAVEYIILHELHHICFGHLNPLNPIKNTYSRLWESNFERDHEKFELLQGYESLSDWGAGKVFGLRFKERASLGANYPVKVDDVIYANFLAFSLKLCHCIVYFEGNLFGLDYERNTHPHSEIRFISFFDGVREGISERPYGISAEWEKGIAEGYWAFTKSFQDLHITEPILLSILGHIQPWYGKMEYSKSVIDKINLMINRRLYAWHQSDPFFLPFLSAYRKDRDFSNIE